jgi:hypothetical protein
VCVFNVVFLLCYLCYLFIFEQSRERCSEICDRARRYASTEDPHHAGSSSGRWVCNEGKGFNIARKGVVKFEIDSDQLGA